MKTIIAGSRDIGNYMLVRQAVALSGFKDQITEVVSGGARGIDRLGERYAKEEGIPYVVFTPEWEIYGKRAGILRNAEMADYADALIAIWDGESRGTKHMIDDARKKGLKVFVFKLPKYKEPKNEV